MPSDVVEMLLMPEIITALTFETEMGLYFEVTSSWHGHPGCLSNGKRCEYHSNKKLLEG